MKKSFQMLNEAEVTAFVIAAAIVALLLMLGDGIWKTVTVDHARLVRQPTRTGATSRSPKNE